MPRLLWIFISMANLNICAGADISKIHEYKTFLCFNALSGIASWTFSVCIDAFSQWSKKIYKPQNLTTFSFFSRRSFDWTTFSKLSSWSALLVCLDPSTVVKLNVTVVLSSKKRYVNKTMLWIAYLQLVSDN